MQVQSVNSNINRVKFGSEDQLEKAVALVNMDDVQIRQMSLLKTKQEQGKQKNYLKSLWFAFPLAATVSSFILKNEGYVKTAIMDSKKNILSVAEKPLTGKFSSKLSAAGNTAMFWGGVLLVSGIYNSVKKAIVSKSEKMQNFERNHPFASLVADIGLFLGTLSLAKKGADKVANKIIAKSPEFVKGLNKNIANAKNWLDTTKINTKVLPKFSEYFAKLSKKAPFVAELGVAAVSVAPIIVLVNSLLKASKQNRDFNNSFWNNYRTFKEEQFQIAKHTTNVLSTRNDILKKDSPVGDEVEEFIK